MRTFENFINKLPDNYQEITKLFYKNSHLLFFDIGACEGESSICYSRFFPNSKIYSFEPLPENYYKLKSNSEKYSKGKISVYNFALSDKKGEAVFFVSSGRPEDAEPDENWNYGNKSSSLLEPTKAIDITTPWLRFNENITVKTNTLDDFCKDNNIRKIDFIHMDVQGAELKVLNGGINILEDVKSIWLEVAKLEYYKSQPLINDIELFMSRNGFYKIKDTVNDYYGDQFYVNKKYFPNSKSFKFYKIINALKLLK